MAEGDGAVDEQEMDTSEMNSDEEALLHFGRFSEARAAVPWDQRTFREKVQYHMDRIFICFFALFVLVIIGEFVYKIWYVTPLRKILESLLDAVSFLFSQDKDEELMEL